MKRKRPESTTGEEFRDVPSSPEVCAISGQVPTWPSRGRWGCHAWVRTKWRSFSRREEAGVGRSAVDEARANHNNRSESVQALGRASLTCSEVLGTVRNCSELLMGSRID